ncbi:hypothetical protein D3C72_1667330 [compost metagenome]
MSDGSWLPAPLMKGLAESEGLNSRLPLRVRPHTALKVSASLRYPVYLKMSTSVLALVVLGKVPVRPPSANDGYSNSV